MLTPRRTLLLLAGFVLFAGAYAVYAQLLGWLDGLPQLPAKMLVSAAPGSFVPPERATSPTQQKLIEAFGEKSPETNYSHYETQIEFRNGESSIVVAAGKPPSNPNSKRVTLSPFSIAVFSKPKQPHLRQPGEVTEISTIHSDKGVLEFDRVITNPAEMRKAKLVQLELHSDPAEALPDPRRGTVHITNNQRSSDPNRFLILRTVGPVFYRDPKVVAGTPAAQGPDFWTDAPVEIVDRQNLPRPVGSAAPVTVPTKSEENRNSGAVAAILNGQRLPPPTVTAVGLRVYLEPDPPPGQPKPQPKPGANPMNGVRRVELLEQVVMNLWIDNGQSIVGGAPEPAPGQAPPPKSSGLALVPPPPAIAAVTGGLGPTAYNVRLQNRALLQIDTRGPFAYDSEKALARFDVVPHSDPNLPNDVQVTKIPVTGGASSLYSQILELEFNGGPTGAARPANAPAIKRLHAWTQAPNGFVTLTSDDNAAVAHGQDLVHEQAESRTTITGAPLRVLRDRSELQAGSPHARATLVAEPGPPMPNPVQGQPPVRKQQLTVRGAGKVELFDAATNAITLVASWQTSLVQTKELVSGREQDLFVLTDNAKFDDIKADFWLKGNILKVWMEPRAEKPAGGPEPKSATTGAKPSLVLAIGNVHSHSAEYDIKDAEQLTAHIKDAKPVAAQTTPEKEPAPEKDPPVVAQVGPMPLAAPVPPKAPEPVAKAPEKPKPPYVIRAKTIETFMTRTTVPSAAPVKPGEPAATATATKYQLDHARCEDSVTVHQDPTDPTKSRGVDIIGRLLLIDGSAEGSVMTVFGWTNRLGEVHQEEMSLLGPRVVLNQVLNSASVEGRGALTMPTNSTLSGGELRQPEVVVVQWRDKMDFDGAKRSAEFTGKVQATQGESSVQCHIMNVVFDRPVYFNPTQKRAAAAKGANEKAKIDKVLCYPAPGDAADTRGELYVIYNQVDYDPDGKLIKVQQLQAADLKMEAQARDEGSKEAFQRVVAEGPGTVRIWQQGEADPAGPPGGAAPKPAAPAQPMQPGAKQPAKKDQEMKLTIIKFSGRMIAVDKGKVFQKATFGDNVKAVSVPADTPTVSVDVSNPPPRAVVIKCSKELVVWSHKKANTAPEQVMEAIGNADVRSDEYEGFAEKITSHGKTVKLTGSETIPARVMSRFGRGDEKVGEVIEYDRGTGSARVTKGFGGSINPKK